MPEIQFGGGSLVVATVIGTQQPGEIDTSAPVKIGGKAQAVAPAPAAIGTMVDAYIDRQGRLVVRIDTALPAGTNEIGGVNITKIGGNAPAMDIGNSNIATQRVVIASNDPNLAAIKTAVESSSGSGVDVLAEAVAANASLVTIGTDVGSVLAQVDAKTSTLAKESGGNIEAIKTAVEGTVKASLQTAIPAGSNEIGGVDVTKIGGTAATVGAGDADTGTLRVAVATDDVNLAAINTALDISQSALRDGIRGASSKDLTTLEADVESIFAQVDAKTSTLAKETGGNLDAIKTAVEGTVKTSLQTAIPAGTNEIGGVDVVKAGGNVIDIGAGDAGAGTVRVAISTDDVNLAAIKDILDAIQTSRTTPVVTAGTGSAAISVSYAPSKAFWLDAVTVKFSATPTTPESLTVTLDAKEGADYDAVLFNVDSSTLSNTDVCYIPSTPLLCASGDGIVVEYPNTDAATYGARIVTREA